MSWLNSFDLWMNALDPLAFMVYVVSPPLLLAALVAAYIQWREDHPPHRGHPAE